MQVLPKNERRKLLEKHSKYSIHYWTGHDLQWYFSVILKPIIYLTIANMVVVALASHEAISLLSNTALLPMLFLAELIAYAWLGASVYNLSGSKTLPRGMRLATATLAGALTGLGLGMVMSLFKIFWFREMWTFFNIVTESGLRFLEGFVVAGVVAILTMVILKIRK